MQTLIDSAHEDMGKHQEELDKLSSDVVRLTADVERMKAEMAREAEEQEVARAEIAAMETENAKAVKESQELKLLINEIQDQSEAAIQERDALYKELADEEAAIREERQAAEETAEAALNDAAEVRAAQEAERKKWQASRQAHDDLQNQVQMHADLCSSAKTQRDEAKVNLGKAREELNDLEIMHRRLKEEFRMVEEGVKKERERKEKLQKNIGAVEGEHALVTKAHRELEDRFRMRKGALATVSTDLERKRHHIQGEIEEFQRRFQEAKEVRDTVLVEQDGAHDSVGQFQFSWQAKSAPPGEVPKPYVSLPYLPDPGSNI